MNTPEVVQVPKLRDEVEIARLGDEAVLLNADTGVYFGLNDVAARVFDLIDGSRSADDIVDTLEEEYVVDRPLLAADVATFLQRAADLDLLEWTTA